MTEGSGEATFEVQDLGAGTPGTWPNNETKEGKQ